MIVIYTVILFVLSAALFLVKRRAARLEKKFARVANEARDVLRADDLGRQHARVDHAGGAVDGHFAPSPARRYAFAHADHARPPEGTRNDCRVGGGAAALGDDAARGDVTGAVYNGKIYVAGGEFQDTKRKMTF